MGDARDTDESIVNQIRPLRAVGVRIDVKAEHGADVDRLQHVVKRHVEESSLAVVTGLDLDSRQLVELMTVFGPRSCMTDWSKMPIDPEQDGVEGAPTVNCPNEPLVRYLGNVVDEKTNRPATLLDDIGYEWHQDSSTASKSVLYCISSPAEGAETLFAGAATLFSRLSSEQQAFAETAVAERSNTHNAGGSAAFDAHYGLRMSHTGCRRLRPVTRRWKSWNLNPNKRPLSGIDSKTGERLFWGAAKNFDSFVGMDPEESQDKLEELMHAAFFGHDGTVPDGTYDDDLRTLSRTDFPEDVVLALKWLPGMACVWDNSRVLHSTTPVCLYESGDRKMMHMIMQSPEEDLVKYE